MGVDVGQCARDISDHFEHLGHRHRTRPVPTVEAVVQGPPWGQLLNDERQWPEALQ